jgi:hypothetical protein
VIVDRRPHPGSRLGAKSREVPAPVVAGLALMAGAFGLDLVAHGASLESVEPVAHVAGIAGMAVTWLAVVIEGVRRNPRA